MAAQMLPVASDSRSFTACNPAVALTRILPDIPLYAHDASLQVRCVAALFQQALEGDASCIALFQKVFPFVKRKDFEQFNQINLRHHFFFKINLGQDPGFMAREFHNSPNSQVILHSLHRLLIQTTTKKTFNLHNAPELLCAAALLNIQALLNEVMKHILSDLQPDPGHGNGNRLINHSLLAALFATSKPGNEELFAKLFNQYDAFKLRFPDERATDPLLTEDPLSMLSVLEHAAEIGSAINVTRILNSYSTQELADGGFRWHLDSFINVAAQRGDLGVVSAILDNENLKDHHAIIFTRPGFRFPLVLRIAAENGHLPIVERILRDDRCRDIPTTSDRGAGLLNAWVRAVRNRHWRVAKLLWTAINRRKLSDRLEAGLLLALFVLLFPLILLIRLIRYIIKCAHKYK